MSAASFDEDLVIVRVRDSESSLRLVGGRPDYASVRNLSDYPAPAAYVLLAREKAIQTKTGISLPGRQTPLAQVVAVTFAVIYAVRNYRQLEGDALRDEVRAQTGGVRNCLLGWTPPIDGGRACQLVAGELSTYDQGVALWTDLFQTQHIIKPEIAA